MSIYDKFKVTSSEREGVWIEYPTLVVDGKTPGFKCRSTNHRANKDLKKAMETSIRKHGKAIARDEMSAEDADKVDVDNFVDTVLVDWRNVFTEDGQEELPFNRENAVELLSKAPKLQDDLLGRIDDDGRFDDLSEARAGN